MKSNILLTAQGLLVIFHVIVAFALIPSMCNAFHIPFHLFTPSTTQSQNIRPSSVWDCPKTVAQICCHLSSLSIYTTQPNICFCIAIGASPVYYGKCTSTTSHQNQVAPNSNVGLHQMSTALNQASSPPLCPKIYAPVCCYIPPKYLPETKPNKCECKASNGFPIFPAPCHPYEREVEKNQVELNNNVHVQKSVATPNQIHAPPLCPKIYAPVCCYIPPKYLPETKPNKCECKASNGFPIFPAPCHPYEREVEKNQVELNNNVHVQKSVATPNQIHAPPLCPKIYAPVCCYIPPKYLPETKPNKCECKASNGFPIFPAPCHPYEREVEIRQVAQNSYVGVH